MAIEFEKLTNKYTNVTLNGMYFGKISIDNKGKVYFNTASIESIEQILAKMKEL